MLEDLSQFEIVVGSLVLGLVILGTLGASLGGSRPSVRASHRDVAQYMSTIPAARTTQPPTDIPVVVLKPDRHGIFQVPIEIAGQQDMGMIDSGCTGLSITPAFARRIGIKLDELDYATRGSTNKGTHMLARFTLAEVRIGPFIVRDVDTAVPQEERDGQRNLIGASVLRHFRVTSANGMMQIEPTDSFSMQLMNYEGIQIDGAGDDRFERDVTASLGHVGPGTPEWGYVSKIRSIAKGGDSQFAADCAGGHVNVYQPGLDMGTKGLATILAHEGSHAYHGDVGSTDANERQARSIENAVRRRLGMWELEEQPTHHRSLPGYTPDATQETSMPSPWDFIQPQEIHQPDLPQPEAESSNAMPNYRAELGWVYGERTSNVIENFARTYAEHQVDKKEAQWRRWYGG